MRILIVGTTYFPALNGQSVFTVNLAEGLARAGHEVAVVFPEERTSTRIRNGVRLEGIGALSLRFLHPESFLPVSFGGIPRVFDGFRPDILHIQDHYPMSTAAVREARRRGIRTLGTNHFMPANLAPHIPGYGLLGASLERRLWNWMLSLFNRLDFVTAPSHSAVALIQSQGLRVPAAPISCGIDLHRFHPEPAMDRSAERRKHGLDPERVLFITVGRVDGEKRLDVLMRAVSRLRRDDVQLAIVGEGAAAGRLEALHRSLQLGDRVRFLGRVPHDELPDLLRCADAFAMASQAELLSIASLEAMATGLPLVLANAMALPELVTPGENGFLFEPGNPEDAARNMEVLAANPGLRATMGDASLRRVGPHSLESVIERYAALYVQVLEGSADFAEAKVGVPVRNRGAEIAHRSGHP